MSNDPVYLIEQLSRELSALRREVTRLSTFEYSNYRGTSDGPLTIDRLRVPGQYGYNRTAGEVQMNLDGSVETISSLGGGGGDHGRLTGLGDDDHAQYVHIGVNRSISAQHTFAPAAAQAPFLLAANAQGQTVVGLRADQLNKSITPGTGLTGGGVLTADRMLAHDIGDFGDLHTNYPEHDQAETISGLWTFENEIRVQYAPGDYLSITPANGFVTIEHAGAMVVSTGANLHLRATGAIRIGQDPTYTPHLQADNYSAGTTGWRITHGGVAEFTQSLETGTGTFHGAVQVDGPNNVQFGNGFIYDGTQMALAIGGQPQTATAWPDSQFKVEINGSLRVWDYIVGKHALQIDDARHIWHFDGPLEAGNFSGVLQSHRGLQPERYIDGTSNDDRPPRATFLTGKFGKALVRGPADTNYVQNPIAGSPTNYWAVFADDRFEQYNEPLFGDYCFRVWDTTGSTAYIYGAGGHVPSTQGTTLIFSAWLKGLGDTVGQTATLYLREAGGTVTTRTLTSSVTLTNDWQKVTVTLTVQEADRTAINHWVGSNQNNADGFLVDGIQLITKSYPTPLIVGDMPDCDWEATAHNSNSTRVHEHIRYSNAAQLFGTCRPTVFSISVWAYFEETVTDANRYIWIARENTPTYFWLRCNSGGTVHMRFQNVNLYHMPSPGEWVHYVVVADGTDVHFYANGERQGVGSFNGWPADVDYMDIGSYGTNAFHNGLIDDLIIVGRAFDIDPVTGECDEVRAIYESGAPVFAETSTFTWNDPTMSIRVDDSGLFATSNDGDAAPVFGLATQGVSWGGHALDVGDLLLGNTTSVLWWKKASGELIIGDPSYEHINADGSYLGFWDGSTRYGFLSAGKWHLGITGRSHIEITASNINFYDDNAVQRGNIAAGSFWFGEQNHERINWDSSNGLQIINNSNVAVFQIPTSGDAQIVGTLDITGDLTAGAGAVTLNPYGIRILAEQYPQPQGYSYQNRIRYTDNGHLVSELYSAMFSSTQPFTGLVGNGNLYYGTSKVELRARGGSDAGITAESGTLGQLELFGATIQAQNKLYAKSGLDINGVLSKAGSTGHIYVPCVPKLSHPTLYNGATYSQTGGGYDYATDWGVPGDAVAVAVRVAISDNTVGAWLALGQSSANWDGMITRTQVANYYIESYGIVNLDSYGRLFLKTSTSLNNVFIQITGYFI